MLQQVVDYSSSSGKFTWKSNLHSRSKVGTFAGDREYIGNNGKAQYGSIQLGGQRYNTHILVWLYCTGSFPKEELDHIDRNIYNNRISNLRECTASENRCNRSIYKNNTSGFKGISWYSRYNKWRVRITKDKVVTLLGYFDTIDEAYQKLSEVRQQFHGEFTHHG